MPNGSGLVAEGRRRRTAAGARVACYFLGNIFEEKVRRAARIPSKFSEKMLSQNNNYQP